eukprot:CAMPEP_0114457296 /NCGR_PEP_ID=MMETSP0104-20121206/4088_1 /TAXON_ID=37642 ORGANISM="Paraphysomonas imperforata, Strain PA2" /NCGR_SAMPLE_ID=MMETSP0104 /ASSEMBLY_ACC=CAM_ASM_000202 /LENGTH=225 /DNA_ID=CAMNT_0001629835 /DNA_START=1 /DNA_END=678 /DNA_ORIENTATION=+
MSEMISAFGTDPTMDLVNRVSECAVNYPESRPIIVGVAGGSGSGKTTIAKHLLDSLGAEQITYIPHDNYYKDLTHLTKEERDVRNFDHPSALDTDLMIADLNPRRVILIEGVLIFADEELASLIDIKIFVDTESDIRFIRRLQRDVVERQRGVESVIEQYMNTVKPMHTLFVEPSKRLADIIIPSGYNSVALDLVSHRLRAVIVATSPVCKERKQMDFGESEDNK